jgi:hypothetical protein
MATDSDRTGDPDDPLDGVTIAQTAARWRWLAAWRWVLVALGLYLIADSPRSWWLLGPLLLAAGILGRPRSLTQAWARTREWARQRVTRVV